MKNDDNLTKCTEDLTTEINTLTDSICHQLSEFKKLIIFSLSQEQLSNSIETKDISEFKKLIIFSLSREQLSNPIETKDIIALHEIYEQFLKYADNALNYQEELIHQKKKSLNSTSLAPETVLKNSLMQLQFNKCVMQNSFDDFKKNVKQSLDELDDLTKKIEETQYESPHHTGRNPQDAVSAAALVKGHYYHHYTSLDPDQQLANAGRI